MLCLVRVVLLASKLPCVLARDRKAIAIRVPLAVGTVDMLADIVDAAVDLPAFGEQLRAARVFKLHAVVVEDVTKLRVGADLTAAHAARLQRVALHRPVDDVEVVHVLLHDVIPGQPREVQPVAQLPLHVAPRLLARKIPQAAHVPRAARKHELAEVAFVDAGHRLEVAILMMPLQTTHDGELLLLGNFSSRDHTAHARGIHRDRLLKKDVLASIDRGFEVTGTKMRRCRNQHDIDIRGEQLVGGVKTSEALIGFYIDAILEAFILAQRVMSGIEAVSKHVCHRHELDRALGRQRLTRCASAAATTTD